MLLITEYHELGSLRVYLNRNTLTPQRLLHASRSIARGLAHLHMEILGVSDVNHALQLLFSNKGFFLLRFRVKANRLSHIEILIVTTF